MYVHVLDVGNMRFKWQTK